MMKKTTLFAAICCSLLTVGTASAQLSGPKGSWPLNEASAETKPANTECPGTLPGVAEDPIHGFVRTFQGGNNKLLNTNTGFGPWGTQARTITYWANLDADSIQQVISFQGVNSVIYHKDNKIVINKANAWNIDDSPKITFEKADGKVTGEWVHVAIAVANGALSEDVVCYVNGEKYADGVVEGDSTNFFGIGQWWQKFSIGHSIYGSMSKLNVFNYTFTANQAKQLYDRESKPYDPNMTPFANLDFPMNEGSADAIVGLQLDGETAWPGATNDEDHGWVRTFESSLNKVKTGGNAAQIWGTHARTFSYWANLNADTLVHQPIFIQVSNSTIYQTANKIVINNDTVGNIDGGDKIVFENADGKLTGEWVHVAITAEEGVAAADIKCYVNGEKYANGVVTEVDNNTMNATGDTIKVERTADKMLNNNNQWYHVINIANKMTGSMSKFKLFKGALTAAQVKYLYDAEKPIPNSIEENKVADRISVQGKTIIVNGKADIQIFDATGRMLMQRNNVNGQMNVEGLSGIYMIRANIDGQCATKKAIF